MDADEPQPGAIDEPQVPRDGATLLARAPRAAALLERVRESGLPLHDAWVVGGAVRDAALGRPAGRDIDLAVAGDGVSFAYLLASATGGDVVAEHAFGTATVQVPLGPPHGLVRVDLAATRSEAYREPGALPDVTPGAPIEVDLQRRDVSANAVAVAALPDEQGRHAVFDPCDGLADIDRRLLRVLNHRSFIDDPTRIFRVARYSGRLGFVVDDATRRLAIDAVEAGALATVSADRVRAELELVLRENAWESLTLLAAWGVLDRLEPRLEAAFHPPFVLRRIDDACAGDDVLSARAWSMRLAALLEGLPNDAADWMGWLGFSASDVRVVTDHLALLLEVLVRPDELRGRPPSELYLDLGEVGDESLALALLAAGDEDPELQRSLVQLHAALGGPGLVVRGDDVIALGLPAGRAVGEVLGELFLRRLDGELTTEAEQRAAAAELVTARLAMSDQDPDARKAN